MNSWKRQWRRTIILSALLAPRSYLPAGSLRLWASCKSPTICCGAIYTTCQGICSTSRLPTTETFVAWCQPVSAGLEASIQAIPALAIPAQEKATPSTLMLASEQSRYRICCFENWPGILSPCLVCTLPVHEECLEILLFASAPCFQILSASESAIVLCRTVYFLLL